MKVFLKYVLKSMSEKKGRFLLLIVAISISTALLVVSTGMIDIILDSIVSPQLQAVESKEIVIRATDESSYFYSDEGINVSGIDENSMLKELYIEGNIVDNVDTEDETMLKVTVHGRDKKYVNDDIITQGKLEDFDGGACIISERIADERNLDVGDTLDIIIGGMTRNLKIIAISGAAGVFYNDSSTSLAIIVPYEYLSKDLGVEGKYDLILANSAEETVQEGIDQFNETNSLFTAEKIYDEEAIQQQLMSFKAVLYCMLLVVVIMSSIIIYSSFKLIITERLSTIGTFLSQGATVGKVKFILYLESFTYGLWGALFGNILGIIGLHIINRVVSPLKDYGIYSKVVIEPYYILLGTLFAVILSIISAALPVRRISKLQVKDIILNDVRISKSIGWKKFMMGTALIIVSVAAYLIVKDNLGVYAALLVVTSLTGIILAYPKLIGLLSGLLYRVLRGKSKNVIFAINNLRTSKILLGNISLIIISLVSIITITSFGSSIISVVTEAYTGLNYDIEVNNISTIRENTDESTAASLVKDLKKIGIKEEQINLINSQYGDMYNPETNNDIALSVIGINPDTYIQYNQYLKLDKSEYSQFIKDFKKDEAGVIITTVLSKLIDKKVGDSVQITCNGLKQSLNISGIINGKLYNNSYFILIKNNTMKERYGIVSANTITFSTVMDLDATLAKLKPILREVGASAITRDEMCRINLKNNEMVVNALSIFSYMAIIIAALGIVNNVSISFLQRKSEFAVLASVGMENGGRTKILFVESVASVTWAMLITSLYSILELKLLTILMKSIGLDMAISLNYKMLPMIYLITLAIVLIATIPVYFKSRKLSIIQELKYE